MRIILLTFNVVVFFIFISCSSNKKQETQISTRSDTTYKVTTNESPVKKTKSDKIQWGDVTCEILSNIDKNLYSRILTSKRISKDDFEKVKDSLKISKNMVYFHIPGFTGRGEEYGVLNKNLALEFEKVEKVEQKDYYNDDASQKQKPVQITGDMARRVSITAESFVKKKLKSPKSADFSSNCIVEDYGDNIYTALSYVDAKNSYGAEIRTHYKLKLKWNGQEWNDINNWELIGSIYE